MAHNPVDWFHFCFTMTALSLTHHNTIIVFVYCQVVSLYKCSFDESRTTTVILLILYFSSQTLLPGWACCNLLSRIPLPPPNIIPLAHSRLCWEPSTPALPYHHVIPSFWTYPKQSTHNPWPPILVYIQSFTECTWDPIHPSEHTSYIFFSKGVMCR